ncbi:GGDEF domain-containing protein [Paenibacillus marchantiophytorum]|uniref:GGDEF domain-containing protein n=1 Tax=Paenibacillus marchantiophytorum TaxID=1619310 RepID=A0ABQ2BUE7_9BACL|nr:GGDEF domain-containing protein [Paenibacillus marchantiophytorum]GGI45243.1 GGDEF domain-containing protein [Paenibacillus marchantiophytorum]
MDLLLDMKTIFITLVIGHLFTVILISAYWSQHPKDTTMNIFFAGKCVQALAWIILIWRGGIPDSVTISLANSLLFLGFSLETVALLKLQQQFHVSTKRFYISMTSAIMICFHLCLFFYNVERVRILVGSLGLAILIILPAYRMMKDEASSLLMKMMGCVYLLISLALVIRSVFALYLNNLMGFFTPSFYQTISFIVLYLVMILGNTGFVLLLKERADRELTKLANYDDLTGILNRRMFVVHARTILSGFAKKGNPVSLLLFDIDEFKTINDTYGHDTGDLVLQDLCKRITSLLGKHDLFGRYGGDEFAIMLPGSGIEESTAKAELFRQAIAGTTSSELPAAYTISLGVVTLIPNPDTQLETLYSSCDKALYGAKNNGRNGVFRY